MKTPDKAATEQDQELQARQDVLDTALAMSRQGLSPGRSGNVSRRFGAGMLITPSGMAYDLLRPSDIVFVAAIGHFYGPSQDRGIFRTKDGGKTWQKVLFKDADTGAIDVVIDPTTEDVVAITKDVTGGGADAVALTSGDIESRLGGLSGGTGYLNASAFRQPLSFEFGDMPRLAATQGFACEVPT